MKPQVDSSHYFTREYNSKGRFCSYWHQIDETLRSEPGRVLEVGLGNSFVSGCLRARGVDVVTLDIDPRLHPDICGSILELPFSSKSFDVVMCHEVLEHLPYCSFTPALTESRRVSRARVVISLPDSPHRMSVNVKLPRGGHFSARVLLPRFRMLPHQFDGQHYWETGKDVHPLSRVLNDVESVGFTVERTYCVPENPYHRFFVLVKTV